MAPKRKRSLMIPWSQLPVDVLDNIIKRLDYPVYVVSFGAVCKPWRHVALGMHISLHCKLPVHHCLPKKSPLPMLLHHGCKGPNNHLLSSLNEQKIYGGFNLPELSNKWIVGSGAGWLVTVDTADSEVALLNPLTGKKIPLPHLSTLPCCDLGLGNKHQVSFCDLRKVIVCSYQGCVLVIALVSEFRAIRFCKIGDSEWTKLENSPIYVDDIIMQNGKLYAVNRYGALFEIDVADPAKMTVVAMRANVFQGKHFLVNLCGEVILLERLLLRLGSKKKSQVTSGFKVFKLVEHEPGHHGVYQAETRMFNQVGGGHSWVPLENLGNHIVFIGYNHSMSVDSRIYPRCKGNCIYFADNRFDEYDNARMRGLDNKLYHDVGIYRMAEQKVKHFKQSSRASSPMNMVWLSLFFLKQVGSTHHFIL